MFPLLTKKQALERTYDIQQSGIFTHPANFTSWAGFNTCFLGKTFTVAKIFSTFSPLGNILHLHSSRPNANKFNRHLVERFYMGVFHYSGKT